MAYLGASPPAVFSAPTKDVISGDGSTTIFTLGKSAGNAATIDVFVANVRQEPSVAYTTSDKTLTFTSAPAFSIVDFRFSHWCLASSKSI